MPVSAITTQLRTTNLDTSIDFYTSKLGFDLEFRYEDFYAGIKAGDQIFHLKLVDDKDPSIDFVAKGDHFHLYFTIDDLEEKAADLRQQGISLTTEIASTPWGTREFSIQDDEGHTLYFAGDP